MARIDLPQPGVPIDTGERSGRRRVFVVPVTKKLLVSRNNLIVWGGTLGLLR